MNDYRNFQRRSSKRRNGKGKHGQNRFGTGKHCVQQKNTYSNIFSTKYNHIRNNLKHKIRLPTALHNALTAHPSLTAVVSNSATENINPLVCHPAYNSGNCKYSSMDANTNNSVVQRRLKQMNTNTLRWTNIHPKYIDDTDFIQLRECIKISSKYSKVDDTNKTNINCKSINLLEMHLGSSFQKLEIGIVSPIARNHFKLRRKSTIKKTFNKIKYRMNDISHNFQNILRENIFLIKYQVMY